MLQKYFQGKNDKKATAISIISFHGQLVALIRQKII